MPGLDPQRDESGLRLPAPEDFDRLRTAATLVLSTPRRQSLAAIEEVLSDICAEVLEVERAYRNYRRRLDDVRASRAPDLEEVLRLSQLVETAEAMLEERRLVREPLQAQRYALSR